MDTIEKIHVELETCLKNIVSAGLGNLDPKNIEKLDAISAAATGLGMDQGKKLTDNLSAVLKLLKEGKSSEDSAGIRITALDFYLKHTEGSASTEEI